MTIGLFDSGVGGISVLNEIRRLLPRADMVYYGDTAHAPYGGRPAAQIRQLGLAALERVLAYHPALVVAACNTVTSVAIHDLRAAHPEVPIVGVVPVLKTAAGQTITSRIAVLATDATLASASYADLKRTFASHLDVLEIALPEWVTFVEQGLTAGPQVEQSVDRVVKQIKIFNADVVAFGCTHFPFLKSNLQRGLPECRILDSGAAVARQVMRILTANRHQAGPGETGMITWTCSGNAQQFETVVHHLMH